MGEWSKRIGEIGEEISAEFLKMIGWGASERGVTIPCLHSNEHQLSNRPRQTHGIDYLFVCRSPLVDGIDQNLLVSVKYSANAYPDAPTKTFKEHFTDLAHTLECFKNSDVRRSRFRSAGWVNRTQDIGVLLWINNSRDGSADMVSRLERAKLPDHLEYEVIYLVDNARAQFVYDSVSFARHLANGAEVAFFYAETGKKIHPLSKTNHGPLLPVEYVNASVLPFRVLDRASKERTLVLSTVERFTEAALKRLLGLAQCLSQDWCTKVVIGFPDFDPLNHTNLVQSSKGSFSNVSFTEGVEVQSYDRDFRNLGR